jgi:lipopolysaccharide transport system permease protein
MGQVAGESAGWVENRPTTRRLPSLDLRETWAYRELAYSLALRDFQLRYKQTAFGVAWAVIQPILAAVIFTLVFDRAAGLPSDGIPYPVFVLTGLVVWFYFSSALQTAALSMVDNAELVTKVYFPRLLNPLAAVLPGMVDLALSLCIVGVFIVVYSVAPAAAILLIPVWILAMLFVAFAAGVWLSALNVLYRDVRYTLVFLIQFWLFATPVIFPASIVHGGWQWVLFANPMAGVLEGFRWSLLDGPAPPPEALMSAAVAVVLMFTGIAYFQRVERQLADRI